jgi:sterol desaturase/sphingolipid hydroxylase (fatty acid hydroxylase superfamily)
MAFALPLLAVGAALDSEARGRALCILPALRLWVKVVLVVLILDLAIWLQHLVTHNMPLMRRPHRVHHADVDMDVTTEICFPPVGMTLPRWLDTRLRRVPVTPDRPLVHRSVERHEHQGNCGFCLSIWDHIFDTCVAHPRQGTSRCR